MGNDAGKKSKVDEALEETFPASDAPSYMTPEDEKKDEAAGRPKTGQSKPAKPGAEGGLVGDGPRQTAGAGQAKR